MKKDTDLLYWREAKEELVRFVDSILIGFADDLAQDKNLYPAEFTGRMLGAMSMARRLKDSLIRKEEPGNDD